MDAYQKAHRRTPRLYPEALFWDSARLVAHMAEVLTPCIVHLADLPATAHAKNADGSGETHAA